MDTRQVILGVVLLFTITLGVLTIQVAVADGVSILTVLSVLVLALFGFGIVGALRHPPE
ncbi:MAG: hypothetical protein QOE65_1178 [Solirubrobacteraceae bacterium]|jgi:hypothetical protein|nr:hypothetical protein [Solirubrobacteraceae bacterium]